MQAIILAAGAGTRLRDVAPIKPLAEVAGRPLIGHVVDRLAAAGVEEVVVVTGYRAPEVQRAVLSLQAAVRLRCVYNPAWHRPNGVSVLAAEPNIRGRAILTMSDHVADVDLYRRLVAGGDSDATLLGVDRRIGHPWIDEDDVTRVATRGESIVAIGKHLDPYDAYDTGVFNISPALFAALRSLPDPSLSDGMRLLARHDMAKAIDVANDRWLDVDDARAHAIAEDWLAA